MKLKHQLSIALTLVTALALGASFAVVALLVRREETNDLDRAILAQATVASLLATQRGPQTPGVLEGSGEAPELAMPVRRYTVIYGPDGRVVAATRTFGNQVPPYELLGMPDPVPTSGVIVELAVNDNRLRGVVLPFGEGGSYRLLYALTRRAVDDDLRFLVQVCVVIFLGATAVTGLVARGLGSLLARDVDSLARVARAVASGDLTVRVRASSSGSPELRALGTDMDHMIAQLDALMATQRTFISHAAHELRSPLATLRGELQLALRRPRTADEYRETIGDSLTEVELLIALAEDLLVLARLQGNARPQEASTTLGEALADAVRMSRGLAEARGVRFVEPAESNALGVAVRGSRPDVARAIRNLLDNAVAHSPRGGTVAIELSGLDGRVSLAVVDQGEGVAPQDAPHIFSPFYRGSKEQSGEATGTGLGLAIVQEIVRVVGGDVRLDPAHSPGARFVLELPMASAG